MSPKLRFSKPQRESVKKLGVIDAQIDEMELVFPLCRAILSPVVRLQDVRDELDSLTSAIQTARDRLDKLLTAGKAQKARFEIQQRVLMESFETGGDGEEIQRGLSALQIVETITQRAQNTLPAEQRRARAAHPRPIGLIHDALIRGWGKAYIRVRDGDLSAPADQERGSIPRFPFALSTGPTSAFRQIVGICYEAILNKANQDPERAIKNYVKWYRDRERKQRASLGIVTETRKRVGRKVHKKTDLPS